VLSEAGPSDGSSCRAFLASLRRLEPRVVTVVKEGADLVEPDPDASTAAQLQVAAQQGRRQRGAGGGSTTW
jgi:hypothetical protein